MARKTLIRGADIVTMDKALGDLVGDILIEDGAIRFGRAVMLDAVGAETIDASGMIALPGIIDAHTCCGRRVMRGYVPDLHGMAPTAPSCCRRAPAIHRRTISMRPMSSGFEMLSYGTTTVVDYCHNLSSPDHAPKSLEALKTVRHPAPVRIFVHDLPAGQFPARRPVRRRAADLRPLSRVPRASRPSASASRSIGGPDLDIHLKFARDLEAPRSCIHVNEGQHDRQAERGWPARTRPVGDPWQPDQQSRAVRDDGEDAHAALLHADRATRKELRPTSCAAHFDRGVDVVVRPATSPARSPRIRSGSCG